MFVISCTCPISPRVSRGLGFAAASHARLYNQRGSINREQTSESVRRSNKPFGDQSFPEASVQPCSTLNSSELGELLFVVSDGATTSVRLLIRTKLTLQRFETRGVGRINKRRNEIESGYKRARR